MLTSQRAMMGAAGAAEFYVGSLEPRSGTGTQAITGVGFQPKAIVFWASGSNVASGTWDARIESAIGFTSGPTESYSIGGSSEDFQTPSNTGRRIAAKAITFAPPGGTGDRGEADLDSFDPGGFTLDWTTSPTNRVEVMFMAIGGGVDAKVVNWTSPTSTGNKAVTGAGFEPTCVLHAGVGLAASVPVSAVDLYTGFGAMDAAGNQWANALFSGDELISADTSHYQVTDAAIAMLADQTTVYEEASFVSMDTDGFTVNFTTAAAPAIQHISLCLSGIDAYVGSFTSPATATTKAVTGVGFQPDALMISTVSSVASTTVDSSARWGLGAYDGTNERVSAVNDQDSYSPTEAEAIWKSDKPILAPNNGPSIFEEADIQSLDADGFTADFTTADAAAVEYTFIALATP